MEPVESNKKETNPDKLCNCKKTKCLKPLCKCFAEGNYCKDSCTCVNCHNNPDYEATVQEARDQIERTSNVCNCRKTKCLILKCRCFAAGIHCRYWCICNNCKNKPDHVNTVQEARKRIKRPDEVTDINHLTISTHPRSHDTKDCQNVSQAESDGYSSALCPKQPCPSTEVSSESLSLNDIRERMEDENDISETIGDDTDVDRLLSCWYSFCLDDIRQKTGIDDIPDFIMEDSNLTNTMKSESPGQPTDASVPCSPTPATCCNAEDCMNQTEIDHQGGNHDK